MIHLNQITSDLTYLGSSIKSIQMTNSDVLMTEISEKSFGMDIVLNEMTKREGKYYGTILLKIVVNVSENGTEKMNLEMLLEGAFSASPTISKDEFENLILVNGATALYSIARSKVEIISATAFLTSKLELPMVNILEFYKTKQEKIKSEQ